MEEVGKHSAGILDSDGNILFEKDKIVKRWVEYIQGVFEDPNRDTITTIENQDGAVITENEVKHAIKSLPTHKAAGRDGITAEVLKTLNGKGITILTELLNLIYEHGHIPENIHPST